MALDLLLRRIDPIFSQTKLKNFIITGVNDFLPFPRNLFFSLAARGRGIHVRLAKKPNIYPFKEFIQKSRPDPPSFEGMTGSPDEVAVVQYTRGTSGRPKGVPLTHKNLIANLHQVSTWLGNYQIGKEIFISILPFHQVQGMTLAMNLPIFWAAGAIQQPRFDPLQFLPAVKAHRPTIFPAHASMIESLVWNTDLAKYKISSIKTYCSLGQPLYEEVLQNFERKTGGRVMECYGLSEASPLTHASPIRGKRKVGSIGIPLPDTDAKIVAPEDGEKELPTGEAGELVIQGPQVMKGYWNQPEETGRTLYRGWLRTGDLARMDEEGFFYYVEKIKKQ